MLSKEEVAEKSLAELMKFLKDEELSLQRQVIMVHAKLDYNKNMQAKLLEIVNKKEQEIKNVGEQTKEVTPPHQPKEVYKIVKGKCPFKEKGSSKFCGKKSKKGSDYCVKHERMVNGTGNN